MTNIIKSEMSVEENEKFVLMLLQTYITTWDYLLKNCVDKRGDVIEGNLSEMMWRMEGSILDVIGVPEDNPYIENGFNRLDYADILNRTESVKDFPKMMKKIRKLLKKESKILC